MTKLRLLKTALAGTAAALAFAPLAHADQFNIPGGDLSTALDAYMAQTRIELVVPDNDIHGAHTSGVKGDLTADVALSRILSGTGFMAHREGNALVVVPETHAKKTSSAATDELRLADATLAHAAASVETVVVTSSKIKGDIQTVPIAITALSQEQLTSRQIAGGPDLVKEVPNLTFSKTNFTG
jgi:iron complex outermembrane recepter protein